MTKSTTAALATLIILQIIMLGALYAQIAPHPPKATPLFGIAPLLGAAISAATAAIVIGEGRAATVLSVVAAVIALVSFGPQKYFDAQFPQIWPAVLAGQIAAVTVLWQALPRRRSADQLTTALA